MEHKKTGRMRRLKKTRSKIKELNAVRLSVHRTPQHTYAQLISSDGSQVLASASTLDKELRTSVKHGGNVDAAVIVGKAIAVRGKKAGVKKVAFDRAGFQYHGRIKALADAARESGLEF